VSRLLLDTSAFSAWARGYEPVKAPIQHAREIGMSVVVLGELSSGFRRGRFREENEERLRQFLSVPRVRLLEVDEDTVPPYAAIHDELRRRGTPVAHNDMWIAATAYQHGLRVLTLDGDFQKIPQVLVDYIEPPQA
jgi:tRNA(fMet)-specific endonuclease VapC